MKAIAEVMKGCHVVDLGGSSERRVSERAKENDSSY